MKSSIEFDVETEGERDLAATAQRLVRMGLKAGNETTNDSAKDGTYQMFRINPDSMVLLPAVGSVVSGGLSLFYFDPAHDTKPKAPFLIKSLTSGSSYSVGSRENVRYCVEDDAVVLCQLESPPRVPPIAPVATEGRAPHGLPSNPFDLLHHIDYDDLYSLHYTGERLLQHLADDRPLLRSLIANALTDEILRPKCESLPDMLKYVLYEAVNGARVRLHIFRTDYDDIPHSHRWPMCSLTLRGPIMNRYYGLDMALEQEYEGRSPPVRIAHRLTDRSVYSFSPQLVHWFHGAPGSATLTIRGPLRQPLGNEFGDGGRGFKYGVDAMMEPNYTMTDAEFEAGIRHLQSSNIF